MGNPRERGDIRVLLVEDNEELRSLLGQILLIGGYDTVLAGTAQDAIEALHEGRFDVVISDALFPGGGVQCLSEEMQGMVQAPSLVVITGDVARLREKGMAIPGGAVCLQKPFSVSNLLLTVEALAGSRMCEVSGV